ncbi:MAG: ABC transporter substrate-binding protein [Deltaproteobacteria bacterium]|nr:ABC transporter substrate-binding protein [Candidatus Anaeroferrophillacea bacterium]
MKRTSVWYLIVAMAAALLLVGSPALAAKTIKIGGLFDITGGTGGVGAPYADGVRDCVKSINEQGGINGRRVELLDTDYSYKIPQALAAYKKFKNAGVVAIQGWGTGDTEAMSPLVTKDKIPYMSASYSEHLTNPEVTPYNFLVGTTYADQARVALKYIADTWTDKSRRPRVAFIYNDTGFGRSPFFDVDYQKHHFPAAESYCKDVNVDLVDKQIVDLRATDATPQLLNLKKSDPDFVIVQETGVMSVILKDAAKLNLRSKFFALNWAMSEKILQQAGDAAEGCFWTNPFGLWGVDAPGVKAMRAVTEKYRPGQPQIVNYIQGYAAMTVMAEALKRVGDNLTGEAVKDALESLRDYDTGGLCSAPITFTKDSHKGSMGLKIYQVQGGKLVPATDLIMLAR